MRILQVNTKDMGGGAEKIALSLHNAYRQRGHQACFAVGEKNGYGEGIIEIQGATKWRDDCLGLAQRLRRVGWINKRAGWWRVPRIIEMLADPIATWNEEAGTENFHYPSTRYLLKIFPKKPDILHLHNLHGGYFDLRQLPNFTHKLPVVLTLHDAWLLGGHCVHSFECERWMTGCGDCPYLDVAYPLSRDATAVNWKRRQWIYSKCRLNVATPSQWLMDKVLRSMMMPGIVDHRVIPNGIDHSIFMPGYKLAIRAALGIPIECRVLMFAANALQCNQWKDYRMLEAVIQSVAEQLGGSIVFLGLGGGERSEVRGNAELRFVSFQKDPYVIAKYYQAADLYVHAAKVDTFPNTVIEALACGTPVVATAVGGIPEQIKSLLAGRESMRVFPADEATGVLTPSGDVEAMAEAIVLLLKDDGLRQQMGLNAQRDAAARFSLDRQVKAYLEWYQEILERRKR